MRARETPRCRAPIMRFETPHRVMQRRCPDSVKGGAPTLAKPKKKPKRYTRTVAGPAQRRKGSLQSRRRHANGAPRFIECATRCVSEVRPGTYRGPLKSHCCDCMDPRVQQPRLDWSILASAIVEARWSGATAMPSVSQCLADSVPYVVYVVF